MAMSWGEIWFRAFVERTTQVESVLPADLRGDVQLLIRGESDAAELFFLSFVDGGMSAGVGGLSSPDAVVSTTEEVARRMLADEAVEPGAVSVGGDAAIFTRYLSALDTAAASRTWWAR